MPVRRPSVLTAHESSCQRAALAATGRSPSDSESESLRSAIAGDAGAGPSGRAPAGPLQSELRPGPQGAFQVRPARVCSDSDGAPAPRRARSPRCRDGGARAGRAPRGSRPALALNSPRIVIARPNPPRAASLALAFARQPDATGARRQVPSHEYLGEGPGLSRSQDSSCMHTVHQSPTARSSLAS